MNKTTLTIATRNSKLALWQAERVKQLLIQNHPELEIVFCELVSEGDKQKDMPLQQVGGKDLFVKAIQLAVINKDADIAVHSLKDLSAHDHPQLSLTAFLERGDPRDVAVSFKYKSLADLPKNAIVGTASPRRECLLKSFRLDLKSKLLRGNVDTRLKKCEDGEYDAIILAAAGLQRLGLEHVITEYLHPEQFIPAIGQGIVVAECRREDINTQALLRDINDPNTELCAKAERAFNQTLGGDCFTPLGAFAHIIPATAGIHSLKLIGFLGELKTHILHRATVTGPTTDAVALGTELANQVKNDV